MLSTLVSLRGALCCQHLYSSNTLSCICILTEPADFEVVGSPQLTLTSGASDTLASEVCSSENVVIRNDANLEFDETFMVVLNSMDPAVSINTGSAVVTILEDADDGMFILLNLSYLIYHALITML